MTSGGVLCFPLGTKLGQTGNGSHGLSLSAVIMDPRIPHRTVVWPGGGPAGAWESPAEQAGAAATAGRTRPLILLETLLSSPCKAQSSTWPWKVCQEALDKILSLRGIMGMALDTDFSCGQLLFQPSLDLSLISPTPRRPAICPVPDRELGTEPSPLEPVAWCGVRSIHFLWMLEASTGLWKGSGEWEVGDILRA